MIIIAGDTLFQVSQGVVALHCPALAAQVDASTGTIDGCPAIRVTDTPYDITPIPGIRRVDPSASSEPFSVLAAWVRIGTKYDMGKLIDYALAQLEPLFPSSLAEWDERGSLESRYAIEALNLFQATG